MLPRLPITLAVLASLAAACVAAPPEGLREESDEAPAPAPARLPDGRRVVVDEHKNLTLAGRLLLDRVAGTPAVLADGRLLAARATDLGEGDLWLVNPDVPSPPRALAAAPGADGQPFIAHVHGREQVLFVSDRTGVAAVFVVDLDGTGLRQLTNQRARPGKLGDDFIPPPVAWLRMDGRRAIYDAGDRLVALDVVTGAAEVL